MFKVQGSKVKIENKSHSRFDAGNPPFSHLYSLALNIEPGTSHIF